MSHPARLVLAVVVVSSLASIGTWAFGQARPQPVNPVVISGNDLGFRIEGHTTEGRTGNDVAVGRLVVRINGQWVVAQLGGQSTLRRPATN